MRLYADARALVAWGEGGDAGRVSRAGAWAREGAPWPGEGTAGRPSTHSGGACGPQTPPRPAPKAPRQRLPTPPSTSSVPQKGDGWPMRYVNVAAEGRRALSPRSHARRRIWRVGWNVLGPSSQRKPSCAQAATAVTKLPPRSRRLPAAPGAARAARPLRGSRAPSLASTLPALLAGGGRGAAVRVHACEKARTPLA